MSYRRDSRYNTSRSDRNVSTSNEQIPLPIEMMYNLYRDALTVVDSESGDENYFQNGEKHFNRIYFKYPPEWKTSNVGEKIIGIRNMKFNVRKCCQLEFALYIRKFRQDKFKEIARAYYDEDMLNDLDEDQIQDEI